MSPRKRMAAERRARLRAALRIIDGRRPRGRPPHPGSVLRDEFLLPFEISQNALARHIGVPPRRINEIVLGKRAISPDTALRLGAAFATSPHFWLRLQAEFDLVQARARHGEPVLKGALGECSNGIEPEGGSVFSPMTRRVIAEFHP